MSDPDERRVCPVCNQPFVPPPKRRLTAKYCSRPCRNRGVPWSSARAAKAGTVGRVNGDGA